MLLTLYACKIEIVFRLDCKFLGGLNMSAINMERLRVIQTFFVPVEREKLTVSILNELEKYLGKVSVDVEAWWVEERQNTIIFTVNYENMYLLLNLPRARKRDVAKITIQFFITCLCYFPFSKAYGSIFVYMIEQVSHTIPKSDVCLICHNPKTMSPQELQLKSKVNFFNII